MGNWNRGEECQACLSSTPSGYSKYTTVQKSGDSMFSPAIHVGLLWGSVVIRLTAVSGLQRSWDESGIKGAKLGMGAKPNKTVDNLGAKLGMGTN